MGFADLKARLHNRSSAWMLILLALGTSALFKVAAFAREAFIASKFGLSSVTDAYFGLQQLPLIVATYMFGAFSLAYAPAFAESRRKSEDVDWLPGLTVYGLCLGLLFTVAMLAAQPLLLQLIHTTGTPGVIATLRILSICFAPIILIGLWSGICTARGQNLWAMTMTGLPYLIMVLWLFSLYGLGKLDNLSLPESMTAGFVLIGIYSLIRIYLLQPKSFRLSAIGALFSLTQFRAFLRQLGASSLENVGYASNQLLVLYFISHAGEGMISGNNCAMRIGMLGFNLFAMPMAQLVQAKLCSANNSDRRGIFRKWFLLVSVVTVLFSCVLYLLRTDVIRLVYMHGKFQAAALEIVAGLLPAWIAYIGVMSMNALVARYLFIEKLGSTYARRQIMAYAVANVLRFLIPASWGGAWVIWCSVISESMAMLMNLRSGLRAEQKQSEEIFAETEEEVA